ncbi:hypothetical protein ElyMa_000278800 [Elysia marginata]|uniref:Uncharacterized protein n=1 Tax=Elysia marginata TaxID=1093978 RepID=A0AAV4F539_9GAST|nr:hypothetical protein ElyMa_000278800 [Elysia marginata]
MLKRKAEKWKVAKFIPRGLFCLCVPDSTSETSDFPCGCFQMADWAVFTNLAGLCLHMADWAVFTNMADWAVFTNMADWAVFSNKNFLLRMQCEIFSNARLRNLFFS